jgi:hypothetical protein
MWQTVGMDTTWKTWTLTIASAAVATLLATGNGQIVIDVVAATGIATADGLTWLIAQGAAS